MPESKAEVNVDWVKLLTRTLQDEKIRMIRKMPEGDAIIVCFFQLIFMAGECNDGGNICISEGVSYNEEELAAVFDREIMITRLALVTMVRYRMIDFVSGEVLFLRQFEKHQNIEGLNHIKQINAARQQRYRDRRKDEQLSLPEGVTQRVTQRYSAEESRSEEIKEKIRGKNREDVTDALLNIFYEITNKKRLRDLPGILKSNRKILDDDIIKLHQQAENL